MKKGKPKTTYLKKLVRERRLLSRQEEQDRGIALEGLRTEPKKAQEVGNKVIVESVNPQEALNVSPLEENQVPENLRGLSAGAVLVLEADGALNEEEKKWLMKKKFRYQRRYIPPEKRWMN